MRVDLFDFELPQDLIAQRPVSPRDAARLLDVSPDGLNDRKVGDLPDLLRRGDLLVFNDTRVIPARLIGTRAGGGKVEALLTDLGFNLSSVPDSHLCCGSAGTYSILQPGLAQQLLKNKIAALTSDSPAAIITANIGCQSHLQTATGLPVMHWIELLDQRLGRTNA